MIFNRLKNNKRIKGGFTLTEALLVVALIMILGAVAIIIAPNFKRKLTQKELDNKAELIFQVAQSNLTGLKASDQESVYQDSDKYTALTESLEDGVDFSNMCYFIAHADDEFTKKIVPQNEIDAEIWGNNWLVIYNHSSGTVYGVFYSVDKTFDSSFVSDMKNLAASSENRLAYSPYVGYFGGGNTGNIMQLDTTPTVKITNSEKLYAIVTIDNLDELLSKLGATSIKVTYEYEIYQPAYGTHIVKKVGKTLPDKSENKCWIVMDALTAESKTGSEVESDRRFATQYPELIAGANAYLKVRAIVNGIPSNYSKPVKFNTLFSSDTVDMENSDPTQRKIVVANVRHLINLSMQSGCDYVRLGVKNVVQKNSITFRNSQWKSDYPDIVKFDPIIFENETNCVQSYSGYNKDTKEYYLLSGFDIKYVGDVKVNGKTIDEIDTSKTKYGTGIFASFWGSSIYGVKVSKCKSEDGRNRDTGTLVGKMESKSGLSEINYVTADRSTVKSESGNAGAIAGIISNCNVKSINKHSVGGESTVSSNTGRAGFIAGTIINTSTTKPVINDVTIVNATISSNSDRSGYLAGLVKNIKQVTNVKWKKATDNNNKVSISGGDSTGGLAGAFSLTDKIDNCTLSSFEITSKSDGGGLIGYTYNFTELSNCTVDKIKVTAAGYAGGIFGEIEGNNAYISDYSGLDMSKVTPRIDTVNVLSSDGSTLIKGSNHSGGIIGQGFNINLFTSCKVESAKIQSTSGCAGGIAGCTKNCNYFLNNTVDKCEIKADTNGNNNTNPMSAGGVVGCTAMGSAEESWIVPVNIDKAYVIQTGIYSSNPDGAAGGIVGLTEKVINISQGHVYTRGTSDEKSNFQNNENSWALIDAKYAGGIIGKAFVEYTASGKSPINIIQSDAASVIGSSNGTVYSGGVIGLTDNDTLIQQSYSCSYVRGKYVGGLIGTVDGSSRNCNIQLKTTYAAGYLSPIGTDSIATGIGISDGNNTISGYATYTVCYLTSGKFYATITGFKTDNVSGMYYAKSGTDKKTDIGTPMTKNLLDIGEFVSTLNEYVPTNSPDKDYKYIATEVDSAPYNLDIKTGGTNRKTNEYPYPQFSDQHGDYYTYTPDELPGVKISNLAYFESYKYSSGTSQSDMFNIADSIGLYFSDTKETISWYDKTYPNNHIYADGYALAIESKYTAGTITLELNGTSKTINVTDLKLIKSGELNKAYKVVDILDYFGIKDGINTYTSFYYKLKVTYNVTGKTGTEYYYFNPRLAKSVVVEDSFDTTPEIKNGSYYIRTPKHTYGLAQTYLSYWDTSKGSTFYQEKDIDYDNYNWSYVRGSKPSSQIPIGADFNQSSGNEQPFTSNYEGGYHYIKGIYPAHSHSLSRMGFFAIIGEKSGNKSKISNLFLVNYFGEKTIESSGSSDIGAFAGQVEQTGTIYNCATTGFSINNHSTNYVYMGGFVGRNNGIIANCEANTTLITVDRDSTRNNKLYLGGFVGYSDSRIENCICVANYNLIDVRASEIYSLYGGFAGETTDRTYNSYCFTSSNDKLNARFSHDEVLTNATYNLQSEYVKITLIKYDYQKYTIGTLTGRQYRVEAGVNNGGRAKENLSDFNPGNIDTMFYKQDTVNTAHRLGKPSVYTVPQFSRHNTSQNYLVATVKLSASDNSYTHFGEWPVAEPMTSSTAKVAATMMVRTPEQTEGTASNIASMGNEATVHLLFMSSTPKVLQLSDLTTDETELTSEESSQNNVEESKADGITDVNPNNEQKTNNTTESEISIETGEIPVEQAEKQSETILNVKSMSSMPIFVNVIKDDDGEDITSQVEVIAISSNDKVKITGNVPLNYVDEITGKTIEELTNPQNGEYKNSKVFLITGDHPGLDEISISLMDKEIAENPELKEKIANPEDVFIEDGLVVCQDEIVTTYVEKIRHIGITKSFTEDSKAITGDIILPENEISAVYSSDGSNDKAVTISNVPCTEDPNANILIYSIDGYGFDSNNNGYSIKKIEVIRQSKPNRILEVLGIEESSENSRESFVVYDDEIISDSELTSYKWDFSEYYCKLGKTIDSDDGCSRASYLPITLTGRQSGPVTFKITLQHNGEIIVLTQDLESVQNEFEVVHMDGSNVVRKIKAEYGSVVYHPNAEEFEKAKTDKTGYIYPDMETISDSSNWSPSMPNMIYEDVTFSLNKTPITYTIILDPNGGEGSAEPITAKYGDMIELNGSNFKNGELEVIGWALEPDGEFAFGRKASNVASEDGSTVTLYAMWGEKEEPLEGDEMIVSESEEPAVTEGWLKE